MNKHTAKLEITKQKLRGATRRLLSSCSNPAEVTSRVIAREAGVQLAMINYCFGSREALLFEVHRSMAQAFIDGSPELAGALAGDLSPKEKLKVVHYVVARYLLEHFEYTGAITGYVLLQRDLGKGLSSLPFVRAHYGARKSEEECRLISFQLSVATQMIVLRHKEMPDLCGLDPLDPEELRRLVALQVDLFLIGESEKVEPGALLRTAGSLIG